MSSRIASTVVLLFFGAFVAMGCGGSSQPEFCSKADDLQGSLSTLKSALASGNVSAIKAAAEPVKGDADAVVASARSDFPIETGQVELSVSDLYADIQEPHPTPNASYRAHLEGHMKAVVASLNLFKSAARSECD